MKVLKFGGSSVGNAERVNNVINILIERYIKKEQKIAVVFSAFQGITDKLIEIGKLAFTRNPNYKKELTDLIDRHYETAFQLNPVNKHGEIAEILEPFFEELKELTQGIYLVKELSPRTLDYILSFGERLSCSIISTSIKNRGIECEYLDASKIIKTDENFGNATVDQKVTYRNITNYFKKHNKLQIITGFIASTQNNEITTLGRGGSDYTASIFGAALNVKLIEIWTDVDGILTADPRKVKNSFSLPSVTYEEAMEKKV